VADTLRTIEHDGETLKAQRAALAAGDQALKLLQSNYKAGLDAAGRWRMVVKT